MTATTVTNFRKNVFEYVSNAIRFNDPVQVTTKEGTAVLLSEEDYNGLLASVEIMSVPGMAERIIEAGKAPDDEYVDAEVLGW